MSKSLIPVLTILYVAFVSPCMLACEESEVIAVVGGTLIDLTDWGKSSDDIENSVVLIEGDRVAAVIHRDGIVMPEGAKVIDARGKYILPGLIDCFAALNNQAYANAYLYMGVTSIVAVSGGRRGPLFEEANPGPRINKLEGIGSIPTTTEDLLKQIEKLAADGHKIALLMYKIEPEQLKAAVCRAHELGMGTIGELGYTTYSEAGAAGIDAYVHTTRYSLDIAPLDMRRAVALEPFSDDLDSPKWRYYKYLSDLSLDDPRLLQHAKVLGSRNVYLMPTMSLLYADLPDSRNPWREPVASILNSGDVNNPVDKEGGKHVYDQDHMEAYAKLALRELELEKAYRNARARYLAGSGTDVWGTMPGISLHTELRLLVRIGLTPREAIAAATSNVADAFSWNDIGLVELGRKADVVIIGSNPLEDIENLKDLYVLIKGGKIIDRESLLR